MTKIHVILYMMMYNSLLRKLYNINQLHPVKMGLTNAKLLYKLFGDPVDGIPIIHVAGTNGKGSVSLKIAECLKLGGVRTGLFVSPHISSFRERIQVNGESMSDETVVKLLPELFEMCESKSIPATFFELTSTLAFMAFKRANCEAIVLEVGLGGRLDATNIISPTLCIITSIQLDHMKILGDTLEKIAVEKAGIMKPGVDVLVGPGCPIDFLRAEAKRVGAPFYTVNDVLNKEEISYKAPLNIGEFADIDNLNTDIARAALALLERKKIPSFVKCFENKEMLNGLSIRPPCRFEIFKHSTTVNAHSQQFVDVDVDVVLDIAHNEDAMIALVRKVKGIYKGSPIRVVLGMSADKDLAKCLNPVLDMVDGQTDRIHCTAARQSRALSVTDLKNIIEELRVSKYGNSDEESAGEISTSLNERKDAVRDDDETEVHVTVRTTLRAAIQAAVSEYYELHRHHLHPTHPDLQSPSLQKSLALFHSNGGASKLPPPLVVVCGTAFVMAEARAELGVKEPRDSESLSDPLSSADLADFNRNIDAQEFFGEPTSSPSKWNPNITEVK